MAKFLESLGDGGLVRTSPRTRRVRKALPPGPSPEVLLLLDYLGDPTWPEDKEKAAHQFLEQCIQEYKSFVSWLDECSTRDPLAEHLAKTIQSDPSWALVPYVRGIHSLVWRAFSDRDLLGMVWSHRSRNTTRRMDRLAEAWGEDRGYSRLLRQYGKEFGSVR